MLCRFGRRRTTLPIRRLSWALLGSLGALGGESPLLVGKAIDQETVGRPCRALLVYPLNNLLTNHGGNLVQSSQTATVRCPAAAAPIWPPAELWARTAGGRAIRSVCGCASSTPWAPWEWPGKQRFRASFLYLLSSLDPNSLGLIVFSCGLKEASTRSGQEKEGNQDRTGAIRKSVTSGCCRPGSLPRHQNS